MGQPILGETEKRYVLECIESGWISANGAFVTGFERAFADFCETKHASSCANGTLALQLAFSALELKEGQEVIVPTLTYVATANAVAACGATPVLVDVTKDGWGIDPFRVEEAITSNTVGIVPVHLYGQPADLTSLLEIAQSHGLWVVEDAAEAHGARWKGRPVGSWGDVGAFSFFANKIITTGEGGMVVSNDARLAGRMAFLKDQAMDSERRYWFPERGFNYRMTNLQAAIGLAQLENFGWHLEMRLKVVEWYRREINGIEGLAFPSPSREGDSVPWMVNVLFSNANLRMAAERVLGESSIETRPIFHPLHRLPMYSEDPRNFSVAEEAAQRGLTLPTHAALKEDDVMQVCAALRSVVSG